MDAAQLADRAVALLTAIALNASAGLHDGFMQAAGNRFQYEFLPFDPEDEPLAPLVPELSLTVNKYGRRLGRSAIDTGSTSAASSRALT